MIKKNIRVRFAPSPTGHLHVGSLRTALFNWLFARHHGGAFLLRIEDTDTERSKKEYLDAILTSLKWTGVEADEPITIQSTRMDEHKKVLAQLITQGDAYHCFCSQEELVARYEQKTDNDFYVKYDGYCRNRRPTKTDIKKLHVIRFKLPNDRVDVSFDDLIRGHITIGLDQFDDFIIARSDGRPIYNFVVVVDDTFMNISHVIRGEDHIANTPKQLLLYEALGYTIPKFAHIPIILGPSGDRLSKRDGATSVLEYRHNGYLAEALVNYLARLGWSHGDQEIFTKQELIEYFSLDHVGKKGAIFDPEKLAWVNSVYIRHLADTELYQRIIADVQPDLPQHTDTWKESKVYQAIALFKERVKTIKDLADSLIILLHGPQKFAPDDMKKWIGPNTPEHIRASITALQAQESFDQDALSLRFKELAKQLGVKMVHLAQPMRIALLGNASGPGVFALLALVGKEQSIARARALLDTIHHIELI